MVGNTNGIREAILATMASTKMFRIISTNSAELDTIPTANADWVVGTYTTAWANRPSDYGMTIKLVAPSSQWGYELAFPTNTPSIYIRTSINGGAWSAWVKL